MIDPQRRFVTIGVRGWLTAAAVFGGAVILWTIIAGALNDFVLLFAGILFAAGMRPSARRLSTRMPFGVAVGVAFGGVLLLAALIMYFLAAPLVGDLQEFVKSVPTYVNALQGLLAEMQRYVKNHAIAQQIASNVAQSAGGAMSLISAHILTGPAFVLSLASNTIIIILLAIGWILTSDALGTFVLSLLPPNAQQDWRNAFDTISSRMSAYVGGVVLNGAIVGVVMGIALGVLGVPYALLLAFFVAVLQGIPLVGAVISGIVLLLAVLVLSGLSKMLIVLAILAIVQIIDQNVLTPLIFGKSLQLSFFLIIFSTLVGGSLFGIAGAFLAVPAAAALQVIVTLIVAPAIRRATQAGT